MNVEIWGWDTPNDEWVKVLVDSLGHLQVDVLSGVGVASQCYGWIGDVWYHLLVESAANPNLRTSLYHGVNQIVSVATPDDIGDINRGLFTQAGIRGADVTFWKSINAEDNPLDALLQDRVSLSTISKLYGFNGTTWSRLRVESDALFNLRVRLFAGANAIASEATDATFAESVRGLVVASCLYGFDGTNWRRALAFQSNADGQVTTAYSQRKQAYLFGFNGTTWDRLRVEADDAFNLRVKLFDGANGIDSDQLDSVIVTSGDRGILTRSQVCGYNLEPFHQRRSDTDALAAVARELCQMNIAALYGFDGSAFDRLRTYGTGILKVARAEAGLSTSGVLSGDTSVKGSAGSVYWMSVSDTAALSIELNNSTDGSGTDIWAAVLPENCYGHYIFDPPLEFSTGIYLDVSTVTCKIVVGYL